MTIPYLKSLCEGRGGGHGLVNAWKDALRQEAKNIVLKLGQDWVSPSRGVTGKIVFSSVDVFYYERDGTPEDTVGLEVTFTFEGNVIDKSGKVVADDMQGSDRTVYKLLTKYSARLRQEVAELPTVKRIIQLEESEHKYISTVYKARLTSKEFAVGVALQRIVQENILP